MQLDAQNITYLHFRTFNDHVCIARAHSLTNASITTFVTSPETVRRRKYEKKLDICQLVLQTDRSNHLHYLQPYKMESFFFRNIIKHCNVCKVNTVDVIHSTEWGDGGGTWFLHWDVFCIAYDKRYSE